MNTRIHTLQLEINKIESMLAGLNGPLMQMALDELNNLQFELDTLKRSAARAELLKGKPVSVHEEPVLVA